LQYIGRWYIKREKEKEGHICTYILNGNDRGFVSSLSFFMLLKEMAHVQYDDDDDDNCKETADYFVLPSRTIMNYQARLSF